MMPKNIDIQKILRQINEFWTKQSSKRKKMIIAGALCLVAVAAVVALLMNRTDYVVLYKGLSATESAEIMSKLEEAAVGAKVESDGTIYVPRDKEAGLKIQLSAEGYPKSSLNYDIFSSNTDFLTTDYEKRQYLIFQLQDRLQQAIKTIQGINNAIVTISVSDQNSYVLAKDAIDSSASVILDVSGNTVLNKKQITGIEQLVAKSVPGLKGENVAIIDSEGAILNGTSADSLASGSFTKIEIVNQVNEIVKNKVISLLEPVFGKSGVSIAVNATIDFDKKSTQTTSYQPQNGTLGIISKQNQTVESVNGGALNGGIAGTGSNNGVTTYPQANSAASGTSTAESSETEYLVNQLIESVESDGGQIKDMTVAVMINRKEMAAEDIEKYKQIVAYGVGLTTDKVVVTNVEFTKTNEIKAVATSVFSNIALSPVVVASAAGVLLLIILAVLLAAKKKKKKRKSAKEDEEFDLDDADMVLEKRKSEIIPGEIVLNETREQGLKRQIKDFSTANTNIVAQLLRTWIKEDGNDY